ncbi:MAG: hypothetical protein FWE16_03530 [Firmicutes bacterium]|nr:hypothetical protein [Bacillota bacterium]
MKKLIEKFWEDMHIAITTQDKIKITQNFAADAIYNCRTKDEMMNITVDEMASSCLEYKDILDCKYSIERIDELANGSWVSIITSSVNQTPYFTVSYFRFRDDKIIELVEYYGDF